MLENVRLKVEAFDYLQLPFDIKEGVVGRIEVQASRGDPRPLPLAALLPSDRRIAVQPTFLMRRLQCLSRSATIAPASPLLPGSGTVPVHGGLSGLGHEGV